MRSPPTLSPSQKNEQDFSEASFGVSEHDIVEFRKILTEIKQSDWLVAVVQNSVSHVAENLFYRQ